MTVEIFVICASPRLRPVCHSIKAPAGWSRSTAHLRQVTDFALGSAPTEAVDVMPCGAYLGTASWLDGRRLEAEESPGSMETRCRITSGGGNPRESATEKQTAGRVIGRQG